MTHRLRVTKTHGALRRWRLYAERGQPEYFEVYLCRDRAAFVRVLQDGLSYGPVGRTLQGLCQSQTVLHVDASGRTRIVPRIGTIVLHLGRMGAGVVAHELQHAAIVWARVKRVRSTAIFRAGSDAEPPENERLCTVMENLTMQFWRGFYRVTKTVSR